MKHMKALVLFAVAAPVCFLFLSSSSFSPRDRQQLMVYQQRDSTVEEIIDFLSEDAIQVCLAYHIFEDPDQVYALPSEEDRVRFFSSAVMCFHLADDYHIYVRSDFSDGEMSIVDDEKAERVSVPLELCPRIWERLIQRDM